MIHFLNKQFNRSTSKNDLLQSQRGISFEQVRDCIMLNGYINILDHHNVEYKHQKILLINIEGYMYEVPCFIEGDVVHLITAYPSRKYSKLYL